MLRSFLFLLILLLLAAPAFADESSDLAKKTQNPISDLISLPLQNNMNFGVGPDDDIQNILNVQPVYPISLSDEMNLITRTIVPIVYQPELAPGVGDEFGIGDTNASFFFSPKGSADFTWGAGPIISMPTSTDRSLGPRRWSLGPTAVALTMPNPWVIGGLVSNLWSVGGSGEKDVNSFLFQYFVNYNFEGGWYLTSAPIMTADWEADSSDRWVVPLGGGGGKIWKLGKQPINSQIQAFGNVQRPSGGADWTLRLQLQFLFPKG